MWQEKDNALNKKFEFKDFVEAFDFMSQVAELAEQQQHHPRWENVYNRVEIWLNTKILRRHSMRSHFLQKKSASRKRQFKHEHQVVGKNAVSIKRKLGI